MAGPKAPTFDQWLTFNREYGDGRSSDALLKLPPAEQRTVYKGFVDRFNSDKANYGGDSGAGAPGTQNDKIRKATQDSVTRYQNYKAAPAASTPPPGAPTPQGQTNINQAQASAQATAGTPAGQTAAQHAQALFTTGGAGNWSPWMRAASQGGTAGNKDLGGPDPQNPSLTDDQVTAFRDAWNAMHPDSQFTDNATFMQSDSVRQGGADAVAAFQNAFSTGSNEQRTYGVVEAQSRGMNPNRERFGEINTPHTSVTTVTVNATDAANASDPAKGGVPALDQYMGNIIQDSQRDGVPWQILWGVLRARLQTDPSTQKGVGMFGVDSGAASASSPAAQISYYSDMLKQGFAQTQDWAFAALYTDNPQSAMQLYHTGKSAPGRAQEDGMYVESVLGGAQGTNTLSIYQLGFARTGLNGAHTRDTLITNQSGGIGSNGSGAGAASGPTINLPDMNALTQSASQLIQQYLLRAPNPGEAEAIAAQMRDASIQAQQQNVPQTLTPEQIIAGDVLPTGAAKVVPNDPAAGPAGITADVKNSSEYQQLYAHKGTQTEADYAKQFTDTQSSMGSNVIDDSALRAGMASGNTNVTAGQIFSGDNANASFRQRLYQIAQGLAST